MKCNVCGTYMKYTKKGKEVSWYCKKCNTYTPTDGSIQSEVLPPVIEDIDFQFETQNNDSSSDTVICPQCQNEVSATANFCNICGASIKEVALAQANQQALMEQQELQFKMQMANLKMQQQQLAIQQQQLQMQQLQYDSMIKCPKCGSTSISSQKKGYGVVKGAAGAAIGLTIAAPIAIAGLAAGNIGRKKVQCTCMKCGYHFKAGKA